LSRQLYTGQDKSRKSLLTKTLNRALRAQAHWMRLNIGQVEQPT